MSTTSLARTSWRVTQRYAVTHKSSWSLQAFFLTLARCLPRTRPLLRRRTATRTTTPRLPTQTTRSVRLTISMVR